MNQLSSEDDLQPLVDRLRQELGEGVVSDELGGGDLWVRVKADAWEASARVARQHLGMDYFCFLAGIDWMQADLGGEKLWDPDADAAKEAGDGPGQWTTGKAGGDSRFQVMCRLYSVETHLGLTLKADVGDTEPHLASLVGVYRGADWHERETWEMYGIVFDGHPGLRHLYLPGEFEGFPLRKDFPLLAREVKPWPGLVNVEGLPGEAADEAVDEAAEGADA